MAEGVRSVKAGYEVQCPLCGKWYPWVDTEAGMAVHLEGHFWAARAAQLSTESAAMKARAQDLLDPP